MLNIDLNNQILFLNFVLYLFAVLIYLKRKKYISIGFVVLLLYCSVAGMSMYLFNIPYSLNFYKDLTLFPFIFLFTSILITAYPLLRLDERKIKQIIGPPNFFLNLFAVFVIFIMFLSSIDVIVNFNEIIVNLLLDSSFGNELYASTKEDRVNNVDNGINILGVLGPAFRDFPQFLLFYFMTFTRKNKLIILGLFISVIISLLSGLLNGLRGNALFVVFSSGFLILFFWRLYSPKIRIWIRRASLIVLVAVSVPFIIISIGRFETSYSSYDPSYAFKSYYGQSFLYFNNYGLDNNGIRYGDRTMNLFKSFFFEDVPNNYDERRFKYPYLRINDEVFSTFVGEFTLDFGPIIALLLLILFSIFILIKTRIKETAFLHQVLLLYFLWNTLTYGIFLFPYSDISGNLRIILFALLFVFLQISTNRKNRKIII